MKKRYFKCQKENLYLQQEKLCDGITDCKYNSDEIFCKSLKMNFSLPKHHCTLNSFYYLGCKNEMPQVLELDLNINNEIKKIELQGNINFTQESIVSYDLTILLISKNSLISFWKIDIYLPNLISLIISGSTLTNFTFFQKQNMGSLQYLDISNNDCKDILIIFERITCKNLLYLNISYNHIGNIKKNTFENLNNLKKLILIKSRIKEIHKSSFNSLMNLIEIYSNGTLIPLDNIQFLFKNLDKIRKVVFEQFQICCIIDKLKKSSLTCIPQPSLFITCDNIIPNKIIRICSWVYSISGLFGNIVTIIFILNKKNSTSKEYRLALSIADLLSIIYILNICIADMILEGEKYLIDEREWRYGISCKILGSVISFSLMFSMFNIISISLERFHAITFPFKINYFKNHTYLILSISFLISLFIGLLPLFIYKVKLFTANNLFTLITN